MKFAKVLETESIPEWRKAYIQYKGLKKRLKSVDRIRKACEHKAALEMVNPAFQDDDDIDHSQFGCCPSSAWQLWRPSTTMTMIRQWTSSHKGGDIQIPCSRSVSMQSTMALTLWDEVLLHANDAERQFFALLDRELDKVSVFYNDKEGEAKTKFQSLKVQIKLIADYGQHLLEIGPPFSSYPALFQSRQQRLSKVPSFVGYSSDPHISYSVARNRLKKALTEYYRSLEFLSSYRRLNQLGFQKILKKFDKIAGWKASHLYLDRIKKYHWYGSTALESITHETETLYINEFADGHRRRGMRKLRVPEKHDNYNSTTWRTGLFLGIALSLTVQALTIASDPKTVHQLPNLYTNLQIYACFFLPILFALGFSIDLVIWHRYRINYKFIFEFNPRSNLDYHQFAELPAFLLVLASAMMYMDFSQFQSDWLPSELCPLILFIVLLGTMLCPFNLFYFDARRWLGVALARIFLSYCFPVEFRDFFIADELNSLAYSFWTLSYFFCAYSWHWTGLDDHCRFSTSWLTPLLASLPPWWRLLQCLRRYKDSNERVHLINGAKYTSSILSTLVSGLKRINGGAWTVYLSIFMSIISSVYTATWDVKMDWGLVQPQSQYLFLRDELVFHRWVYYLAVPINTFLRFSWTLSLAGLNVHPDILTFVLAVMEGMRRIQWNVFRLENEHLNNCGQCRAIKEIPLPFAMLDDDIASDPELTTTKSFQMHQHQQQQQSHTQHQHRQPLNIPHSGNATHSRGSMDPPSPMMTPPHLRSHGLHPPPSSTAAARPMSEYDTASSLLIPPASPIPMRLSHPLSLHHSYQHDGSFYGRRDFENRHERDEAEILSTSHHDFTHYSASAQSTPLETVLTRFWSLGDAAMVTDISDTEQDDDDDELDSDDDS